MKMAGAYWTIFLLVSSAWICVVGELQTTATSQVAGAINCSDPEVYLNQDWSAFTSCCQALYPSGECQIACPCRNGADCFPNNRTCVCKPGWIGSRCQRSCREKSNDTYGLDCKRGCRCGPDATCEPVTGVCECIDNENCAARCPRNRYGPKCRKKCRCKMGGCDHITGACNITDGTPSCGCLHGGSCPADGKPCRCTAAWTGRLCNVPCPLGFYGDDCSIPCGCGENSTCSRTTGLCGCEAENKRDCVGRCPAGLYGPRCSYVCNCLPGLRCNPWTGDCECTDNDNCRDLLFGKITELSTDAFTTQTSTKPTPLATNVTITITIPPLPLSTKGHTARNTTVTDTGSTTRPSAVKRGGGPTVDSDTGPPADGSPKLRDDGAVGGGNEFYPTAPFWGVVGTIAAMLMVVVVLLLLILRRQVSNSRSALTRQPKISRRDNVYETVEELGKTAPTEPEPACILPPLPNMFQRGGSVRSSVHNYHHRPLSVHSQLPAMDAPLPASIAAMVCNNGTGTPPVPGGTSRRSLMAEWRPHGQQSSLLDEPPQPDRRDKALSCIYNSVTIEDDYSDPFDAISPSCDMSNRPPGYLPKLFGTDRGPGRSQSPIQRIGSPENLQRGSSPMTVQRSDSPMTVQRCESPMSVQRSSSLMNVQRSGSPMTVSQSDSNINFHQKDLNMNVHLSSSPTTGFRRGITSSSSSSSPQRQSASPDVDPFYFTLEQGGGSPTGPSFGNRGPEDDYDELEPQLPINSPSSGVLLAKHRPTSHTSSEHSRASSRGSSQGSVTTNSPTLASSFGTSPRNTEMFAGLNRRPEPTRPKVPQRPLSSNIYESCGPRMMSPPTPLDDGIYSKLNRTPAQRSELPTSPPRGFTDFDDGTYGRLQRSYSAKNPPRNPDLYDGPYGKLPQRSRSAMVRSQQINSSADCEASEWVPVDPRPRLPPRSSKPPLVTEPRKKFRWSIKRKQLTKKSSTEEVEYDCPTSAATLSYPVD